jgi:hypothetical protein
MATRAQRATAARVERRRRADSTAMARAFLTGSIRHNMLSLTAEQQEAELANLFFYFWTRGAGEEAERRRAAARRARR